MESPVLEAMWGVTLELAPWLLAGAAVAGLMHALLPPGMTGRLLSGRGAVWKSVLLGVPLPLCSCAVIPVGLGLKRQGASDGAAVAFLTATPQTGVDSILVTAGMLGWPLALFKVATALVTGLLGGYLTAAVTPKRLSLPIVEHAGKPAPPGLARRLGAGVHHADAILRSVWRWLVLGVVVSAAISTYLPSEALGAVRGYGAFASMTAALVVSLPMYVCATASVPIAASLAAAGLPLGAVIVFLMAGPATNVATVGAVYRGLGWRALVVYLMVLIAGSFAGGLLFEALLGAGGMASSAAVSPHTHHHPPRIVGGVSAIALIAWVAWCAARDLRRTLRGKAVTDRPQNASESPVHASCGHGS